MAPEFFCIRRASTRWEREDYRELVSSPLLPLLVPFLVSSPLPPSLPPFRFSNAEERRMAREGVGRWLGNEESGIPPGEGEELMKERDLRIPCK